MLGSTVLGVLDPMPTARLLSIDFPGTGLPAPAPAPASAAIDRDETSAFLPLAVPLAVLVVLALLLVVLPSPPLLTSAGNLGGFTNAWFARGDEKSKGKVKVNARERRGEERTGRGWGGERGGQQWSEDGSQSTKKLNH